MNNCYLRYDIDYINAKILDDALSYIMQEEEIYKQQLRQLTDNLLHKNIKIMLLSTTTCCGEVNLIKNIIRLLEKKGVAAISFPLKRWQLSVDKVLRFSDGSPDFCSINAFDIESLVNSLMGFIYANQCDDNALNIEIKDKDIIIIYGSHMLNGNITDQLPKNKIYKAYADIKYGFFKDDELILSSKNLRMLRYILKNQKENEIPAKHLIYEWEDILLSEKAHIKPYQDNADLYINNFLGYEVCVFKNTVLETLKDIEINNFDTEMMIKIINSVKEFQTIPKELILSNSLLNEFI